MDRADVMRWVERYERTWRDEDLDAVGDLFTDDAQYRPSPYEDSLVGLDAIRDMWIDEDGVLVRPPEPGFPGADRSMPSSIAGDMPRLGRARNDPAPPEEVYVSGG